MPTTGRTTLTVLETTATLRFTRAGRLVPWLGRALRGIVGMRLKERVCVEPWRKICLGCPKRAGCAYGETVEADPPGAAKLDGQGDAVRPLVIAPAFPAPPTAEVGGTLPLRVSFAGPTAAGHARAFWAALADAGANVGLGPDAVTFAFDAVHGGPVDVELPDTPGEGVVPRLRVTLTSPLFLRQRGEDVLSPTCSDLLRAGLRTLGGLARLYGTALPDAAFAALKSSADGVRLAESGWRPFAQSMWSNRQESGGTRRGVQGGAEFADVPEGVAAWLTWAGRLHAGGWRVAGAGGWRVEY